MAVKAGEMLAEGSVVMCVGHVETPFLSVEVSGEVEE
jgi:hypothetical protein